MLDIVVQVSIFHYKKQYQTLCQSKTLLKNKTSFQSQTINSAQLFSVTNTARDIQETGNLFETSNSTHKSL